jgi:hypothetical protein
VSFVELRPREVVEAHEPLRARRREAVRAVNAIAEFNQRAYELFGRPDRAGVRQRIRRQALARAPSAARPALGVFRSQPATWWLEPVAKAVKEHRQATSAAHPMREIEKLTRS